MEAKVKRGRGRLKGCPRPPGSGRKPGTVNKVTRDVREAIAEFAQRNVSQMSVWLDKIEDPARRFELYLRAIEYHIPKVTRMEMSGPNGGPMLTASVDLTGLSDAELEQMQQLMAKAQQASGR